MIHLANISDWLFDLEVNLSCKGPTNDGFHFWAVGCLWIIFNFDSKDYDI